jgi:hypothetical protein
VVHSTSLLGVVDATVGDDVGSLLFRAICKLGSARVTPNKGGDDDLPGES